MKIRILIEEVYLQDMMCGDYLVPAVFFFQVPKPEKHASGTDSDYDNTQLYDASVRSVFECKSEKCPSFLKPIFLLF